MYGTKTNHTERVGSDTIKLGMSLANELDTNCILSRTFAISAALCEVVKVPLLQAPKV